MHSRKNIYIHKLWVITKHFIKLEFILGTIYCWNCCTKKTTLDHVHREPADESWEPFAISSIVILVALQLAVLEFNDCVVLKNKSKANLRMVPNWWVKLFLIHFLFFRQEHLKKKSRDAARSRRGQQNDEYSELASQLPFSAKESSQLDRLSVMRLANSFIKVKHFLKDVAGEGVYKRHIWHVLYHEGFCGTHIFEDAVQSISAYKLCYFLSK